MRRFKFSDTSKKYAFLIAFMIAGALLVSYGFNRIDNQQHTQNSLISLKENQKAACHSANIVRASTNVNSYAEYRAWALYARTVTVPPIREAAQKALQPVLDQTWIPLTNCAQKRPPVEGYPIPTAVKFSVRVPPASALTVAPEG